MNREASRELAELILHFADGGEIESERISELNQWCFDNDPSWNCDVMSYRIKKRSGECWGIINREDGRLLQTARENRDDNIPSQGWVNIRWEEI